MSRRPPRLAAVLAVAALLATGCGGSDGGDGDRTLTVFAAASLTSTFTELGDQFERDHPGRTVRFNFAGSATLVEQIRNGAPADVFASADRKNMTKLADRTDGDPVVFARNQLAIVVPAGNPKNVTGLADLAKAGLTVSLAGPTVPVGEYARQAFAKAGVPVPKSSNETDVKQVVTRVALGQADAGVVYVTDISAAGDKVEGVEIPAATNVLADYPAAAVRDAADPADATAFLALLTSPAGRAILTSHGFLAP